ncbi:MAG: glycosyltransferase [Rhodocyclaceae bacterium]|nr:glycosyltransferase [Rhodocyclaceae bacterium]
MPPVSILVIGHDAGLGGAQLSLLDILARLDPARYRPLLVVPTPGPFVAAARKRGFRCWWGLTQRWVFFRKRAFASRPWHLLAHPWLWAGFSLATLPLRLAALALLVRKEGVRLIYSNTVTVADGALLARLLRLPHVWHLREAVAGNADLDFPLPVARLPDFIRRHASHVIVNSAALRRQLFGADAPEQVRTIWNGIDLDALVAPAQPLLPPDIPPGARLTGICGRLGERKGIDVYLQAVARLGDGFDDVHHLVIGSGPMGQLAKLRALAARLGIREHVHFLGFRDDAPALLGNLSVLVSSARQEAFGRTLIEAMAQGVPVVATKSGGPEEIVEDGKTGFLVDVGDAEGIAKGMARLLADPPLAASLGAAGRQRAHEHFDVQCMAAKVQQVFDEAMTKQR